MPLSLVVNNVPAPTAGMYPYLFDQLMTDAAPTPTSQVELTLSCLNLLNADVLSKSDPYCIVQMKESHQDRFIEIGRTETIDDNLNPEWVKKFVLSYNFETEQKMRFEVWDADPNGSDFLGDFETTLAEIVSYSGRQFRGKLRHKTTRDAGQIVIVTEEVSACKRTVRMAFQARQLEKQSWFVRNDPFFIISRSNEDGSHSVVYRSEVQRSTQNPRFKALTITARTLCNGDANRSIKIDCLDCRSDGGHKLIGSCHTSLEILSKGPGDENKYALRKKKPGSKEHSGIFELVEFSMTEEISFLDYIRSGTQMNFAVAIDFTESNKIASDPQSLHYLNPQRPNCYEIALKSVGNIIQHYNSSKMFPAFGMLASSLR